MTGAVRLVPVLVALWLLTACGAKGPPKPPKPEPQPPTQSSFLPGVFPR